MSGSSGVQNFQPILSNKVAQNSVDMRDIFNLPKPVEVKPGESVLTKTQFQELNKNLDLSGVPRKDGVQPFATQFKGWTGAAGGLGEYSSVIPDGSATVVKSVEWRYSLNKPVSAGNLFKTPPGTIAYSDNYANSKLTLENSSGGGTTPRVGRIEFARGTRQVIEGQISRDTGQPTTKITVGNWGGPQTSLEVSGTAFFDQKNGEMKIVRSGGNGKYLVQSLANAIKTEYSDPAYGGNVQGDFVKALNSAGFR